MSQQPTDNTTNILVTAEKIVESITKSETVELSEVAAKTTENIFTVLVTSGGKPVAVILAIAVVIIATAIPIAVLKLSPSHINPTVKTSQVK
ncbi:hypothetical protein H6G06_11890 [Anabaena sphaerica FACHB-251]|uniref:Uncharacterized protein n=1 Tax=Anabaena sphaerica FACHB-251 TaxID=2692883 RepID=A0A927A136_9NOST|nr:hypothetical protein [Anabaena sphaerica]MBD2294173.1 hypothetical protein [Anabaena sphaerica FACHB-251]